MALRGFELLCLAAALGGAAATKFRHGGLLRVEAELSQLLDKAQGEAAAGFLRKKAELLAITSLRPPRIQLAIAFGIVAFLLVLLIRRVLSVGSDGQKDRLKEQDAQGHMSDVFEDVEHCTPPPPKDSRQPPPTPELVQKEDAHAGVDAAMSTKISQGELDSCCYVGFAALLWQATTSGACQEPASKESQRSTAVEPKSRIVAFYRRWIRPKRTSSEQTDSGSFKKRAPRSCLKDGRPNFTGTWKCVKADGQLDELFATLGLSFFARSAIAALGWGTGAVTREYVQEGSHVKLVQRAMEESVQEFDIIGKQQEVPQGKATVLQTTYWDPENEHVMVFESKDLLGETPNTWTITKLYFRDEDHFISEVTGAGGHTATWTYRRC